MLLDLQKMHTLRIEVRVLILPRIRYLKKNNRKINGKLVLVRSSSDAEKVCLDKARYSPTLASLAKGMSCFMT